MIVGSLNIRGGGNLIKRRRISSIIAKGKADIFMIQESKLEVVDSKIVKSFWVKDKIGWSCANSVGSRGGLITMWKEEIFEEILSFKGEGFLGVKLRCKDLSFYVVNVYSSCYLSQKKKLW